MLSIIQTGSYGALTRPIRLDDERWTGQIDVASPLDLAGPIVLDALEHLTTQTSTPPDQFIQALVQAALTAAVALNNWPAERVNEFRSLVWRSCHNYMVNNVADIDRGPELDELTRQLGALK